MSFDIEHNFQDHCELSDSKATCLLINFILLICLCLPLSLSISLSLLFVYHTPHIYI